ncbi:hypothetical protein HJG60_010172 [Phyllostomus discolor]|uniref:Uncharacterized protein n=1 Tax=Phyllostomus discolor TaxID=89673 RepID=A0A834B1B0_9CHIR|nr:hypothetical protein HJG60_010172 [Phyllostomus discolor]
MPVGEGQTGNSRARLLISSALFNGLSCETGSFSYCRNHRSPQPPLSPLQSARDCVARNLTAASPAPKVHRVAAAFLSWPARSTALLVFLLWLTFFFNSLVVKVARSLISWRFCLFIDFRLVVILLLVV